MTLRTATNFHHFLIAFTVYLTLILSGVCFADIDALTMPVINPLSDLTPFKNTFQKSILTVFSSTKPPLLIFATTNKENSNNEAINSHDRKVVIVNQYGQKEVIDCSDPCSEAELSARPDSQEYIQVDNQDAPDTTITIAFNPGAMGILFLPNGDQTSTNQQVSPEQAPPPSTESSSSNFSKKKKTNRPRDLNLSKPARRERRLLTTQLSSDSQHARRFLNGEQLVKDCQPGMLDLNQADVDNSSIISEEGHRCTIHLKFKPESDQPQQREWVIKLTDAGFKDLLRLYHNDISLITFQQALHDVSALFRLQKHFSEKYSENTQTIFFPLTKIVVVSFLEFITLYKQLLSKNLCINEVCTTDMYPSLQSFSLISEEFHSGYIFLVMQEYVGLRDLSQDEIDYFQPQIELLNSMIIDISLAGHNLKVRESTGGLAVIDVEKDQLSINFHYEANSASGSAFTEALIPELDKSVFEQEPDAPYRSISVIHRQRIERSISRPDSGFSSEPSPLDESTELTQEDEDVFLQQFPKL